MGRTLRISKAALAATTALLATPVVAAQLACIVPPTAPTLRHTGRLAEPGPGMVSVGSSIILPQGTAAAPGLGLRVRVAERLELDWSAFVTVGDDGLHAGIGRAGGAVGLHEGPIFAAACLFGVGLGGFEGLGLLVGGDVGLVASLRVSPWVDLYSGVRFSPMGYLAGHGEDAASGWLWLLPAAGVRLGRSETISGFLEWSGGLEWETGGQRTPAFLQGLTFGLEIDLGWGGP